jgi:hypothetical protein
MTLTITDYAPFMDATKEPKTYTLGEAIKIMVDRSPDYHDGQLEGLVRKVEVLTEITANLAEAVRPHLSDEDIKAIVGYPLMIDGDEDDT